MKITFLICLTSLGITWIVCRAWLVHDHEKTAQILDRIEQLSIALEMNAK